MASPANLVYPNSFDSPEALEDWVMEGPDVGTIDNSPLLVHPKWQTELEEVSDRLKFLS